MILRLLLIFSLSSIGSSFKTEIDLNRCKTETACFIRKSCLVEESTTAAAATVLFPYTDKPLNDDTCDVILETRAFSSKKFHIMVQVNSSDPSVPVTDVKLQQNGMQFRCNNGRATTDNTEFQISSFGERPQVQPNILFCSFALKSIKSFAIVFDENNEKPEILISGQTKPIQFGQKKEKLWTNILSKTACDPEIINSKESGNGTHSFGKVDNTESPITCSASDSLMVIRADGGKDYPDQVICNSDNDWSYIKRNGDQMETVSISEINGVHEIIQVYCVIEVCSLCQPLQDVECAGCTPVKFSNDIGQCATSKCDNGLWRFSDGRGDPAEGEMRCDHKIGSQNQRESVWYFTPKGKTGAAQEVSKAACAIDAVCLPDNPEESTTITRAGCPLRNGQVLNCDSVQPPRTHKDLYCKDGYQLRYEYDKIITDTTNLTCSAITGKYSDDSKKIVPDGSLIFCEPIASAVTTTTEATSSAAAASALSTGTIVGVSFGLLIILAVAGGFALYFVTMRRKRKAIEDNEIAKKEDFKLRAAIANEGAAPNPEKEVYRVEVPEEMKTKWEKREFMSVAMMKNTLNKQEWEEKLYCWDQSTFMMIIMDKFLRLNTEGREMILRHLTAFDEYAVGERRERQKDKKPPENFGNLKQFMMLWNNCRRKLFDCPCCWEYMFRFLRLLYDTFLPYDDHRQISKVMLKAVLGVARPLLNELTYRQRTWEHDTDTLLRPLAIRMLLWAEAPDVIAEMKRMADLPILELQPSVRPVVLQYAARNLGRAESMITQYWGLIEKGTVIKDPDPYCAGSLRQHLLFAICSARDESKKGTPEEFATLRKMMEIMFKYDKMDYTTTSFTPRDQWWAIRGATDSVAGFKPVLDMFIELAPKNLDEVYEKHVDHTVNFDWDKKKDEKNRWRQHVRDLYNLLAQLCTNKAKFNELLTIVTPMTIWFKQDENIIPFFPTELAERAQNFGNLFARKDVTDVFYAAIVETFADRDAEDHRAADVVQVYKNKKRRNKVNWSAHHSHHDREDDDD